MSKQLNKYAANNAKPCVCARPSVDSSAAGYASNTAGHQSNTTHHQHATKHAQNDVCIQVTGSFLVG